MDFEKLLHVARKNELHKKEPVKCLQTKFKPPTKEQREKDKMLSEGVKKFLARKEEEERRKQREAERRKEELSALRAKDPKAQKRIQTMLKRTKSANKSVMEDAIDNNNTADTLAGPSQPDEDDYGFVSETSSQLYNKLIQKMYSTPSDDVPKFAPSKKPNSSNLSSTKERVKMALLKQEEEERLPHKRKKKSKDLRKDGETDCDAELDYTAPDRNIDSVPEREKEKEKPKKKPMPPPVDFHSLLKIAEQKQHEPIVFEPKIKKQEPEVLMTKKQKMEYEKMQEWKRRREQRLQGMENGVKPENSASEKLGMKRIPKLNQVNKSLPVPIPKNVKLSNPQSERTVTTKIHQKEESKIKIPREAEKPSNISNSKVAVDRKDGEKDKKSKELDDETERLKRERDNALKILKEKERLIRERDEAMKKLREKEQLIRERDEAVRKLKLLEKSEKINKLSSKEDNKVRSDKLQKPGGISKNSSNGMEGVSRNGGKLDSSKQNLKPGLSKTGGREFPPKDINQSLVRPGVREFPPKDINSGLVRPGVREFPPKDVQRSRAFPPSDLKRKQTAKKRRVVDSDDDYDSELDDFIDDGEEEGGAEDVSKVISEIFRYDKKKYSRYDDEDDECMESNYAQISKEEFFSTKCGILEDLQDIQKEKAMLAKKKKR